MSRESFLKRVRQAAEAGRAYRVDTSQVDMSAGYVGAGSGDICEALAAEVNGVGGIANLVNSLDEARDALEGIILKHAARSALCWRHELLGRLGLDALLERLAVSRASFDDLAAVPQQQSRATMLAAEIGISSADWVVAETASLVLCSRPGQERLATLLPPVHVAIVERAQIVPDLLDAFEQISAKFGEAIPSNIVLVTGPSKTGDIELTLTTGVHGPGTWHVIIVR